MNELELLERAYPAPPPSVVMSAQQRGVSAYRDRSSVDGGRRRARVGVTALAVLGAAVAVTVIRTGASAGSRASADAGYRIAQPAPNTASLNQRYARCIDQHGANETAIAGSKPPVWAVHIPLAADLACNSLDVAREAAGDGYGQAADELAAIGPSPASFWRCLGNAGYDVTGFSYHALATPETHAYGSPAFLAAAQYCGSAVGLDPALDRCVQRELPCYRHGDARLVKLW